MGIVSTTRTICYCVSGVLVVGCVGFSVNAYILKLLRDDIAALREELQSIKAQLTPQQQQVQEAIESESEEEFHIALESFPSTSSLRAKDTTDCTDYRRVDEPILDYITEIDNSHDTVKRSRAECLTMLTRLRDLIVQHPDTPQLLWRIARILFESGKHAVKAGKDGKVELLEALEFARQSVLLDNENSKCHLWYAILLGDTCKYGDTKEKLLKGNMIEQHVKICLELDPSNSTALHLLGRYCFEVAGIKWWEAKIAAALFGTVPSSTYEEAMDYFLKADDLNNEWTENKLFVVKCLIKLGRKEEGSEWIRKIEEGETEDDMSGQISEVKKLL